MKINRKRSARAALGLVGALAAALALVSVAAADDPDYEGPGDRVVVAGNPGCPKGTSLVKLTNPTSGLVGDGVIQLGISGDGKTASWQLTAAGAEDWDVAAVVVAGGPNAAVYTYGSFPASDSGLTAALVNEERPVISQIEFCVDPKEGGGTPDLDVEKTADATWTRSVGGWDVTKSGALTKQASASGNGEVTWSVAWTKGQPVDTYLVSGTITVRNTGNAVALDVTLVDSLASDPDFELSCSGGWSSGDNLADGATVTCEYEVELDGAVDGTNEATVDALNADAASAKDEFEFPEEPEVVSGNAPDSVDVVDTRFGYRQTVTGGGSVTFKEPVGCGGGSFTNTVQLVAGQGEGGQQVIDEASAQVAVGKVDCSQPTPKIDVQVIKDATAQVTLGANGTAEITYSVIVKNNGPNTANDVVFADGAPSGVEFVPGTLTQGPVLADSVPCTLSASVLNCANLGDMGPGVQTTLSWKATVRTAGTFVNSGTATGTGEDTNPGNNTDDAATVVVAPPVVQPPVVKPPVAKPPVVKPPRKPAAICLKLAVRGSKMVSQGTRSAISFKVTRGGKPVAGAAVVLRGAGIYRVVKTNRQGLVLARVAPAKAGIVTATLSPKQVGCNSARVGVVGVFEPPVTG